MTRYIDADALKVNIEKNYEILTVGHYFDDLFQDFYNAIDNQPTVDAVPVRHGNWIDMGDFEQCSVCTATHLKTIQTVYGEVTWIKSDYCPNCGARMVEE